MWEARMPFGAKLTILFGWIFVAVCLGGSYVFWGKPGSQGYALGFALLTPFVLGFVVWMTARLLTLRVLELVLPQRQPLPTRWELED